jgi:hypothetical protein
MLPQLIPQQYFPGTTLLSFCSFIFLISCALQLKKTHTNHSILSMISVSLLLFYGWGFAGYFYTESLDSSYSSVIVYLGVLSLYIGLLIFVKNENQLHKYIWIVVSCAGIQSFISIFQKFLSGRDLRIFQDYNLHVPQFLYSTIFSSYILLLFPLTLFLRNYSIRISHILIADFLFVLLLVALLISGSKAGVCAIIIQILAIGIYFYRIKDIACLKTISVLIFLSMMVSNIIKLSFIEGLFGFPEFHLHLVIPGSNTKGVIIVELLIISIYLFMIKTISSLRSFAVFFLLSIFAFTLINTFLIKDASETIEAYNNNSKNEQKILLNNNVQDINDSLASNKVFYTDSLIRKIRNLQIRFYYWQGSLAIIKDNWIKGTGPNTFSLVSPLYLFSINDQRSFNIKSHTVINPPSAHNLYLQTASDLGLTGFVFLCTLIYFIFSKSFHFIKSTERSLSQLNFYVVVSILGYLFHNLFEFNWYPSEFIYTFTFMVFIVDFSTRSSILTSSRYEDLFLRGFSVFVWSFILIMGGITLNYFYYTKTIKPNGIFINSNHSHFRLNINRSKFMCSRCTDPFFINGKVLLSNYSSTLNLSFLNSAIEEFDKAVQNNSSDLRPIPYLVKALALQGDFYKAKEYCYKLLKYQKYELVGRMELAIITLVESNINKNLISPAVKIFDLWEQSTAVIRGRDKYIKESQASRWNETFNLWED